MLIQANQTLKRCPYDDHKFSTLISSDIAIRRPRKNLLYGKYKLLLLVASDNKTCIIFFACNKAINIKACMRLKYL